MRSVDLSSPLFIGACIVHPDPFKFHVPFIMHGIVIMEDILMTCSVYKVFKDADLQYSMCG